MEHYREKLRLQVRINTVIAAFTALFALWALAGELGWLPFPEPSGNSRYQSFWRGMISGMLTAVLCVLLLAIVRSRRALKDEKKRKALYIKIHDERTQQIGLYARSSAMLYSLLLGLIGTIVAGFFSMTIGPTIFGCTAVSCLIGLAFKFYYNKKF